MGGKERGIIQLTHHPLLRTITLIVSVRTTTRPITNCWTPCPTTTTIIPKRRRQATLLSIPAWIPTPTQTSTGKGTPQIVAIQATQLLSLDNYWPPTTDFEAFPEAASHPSPVDAYSNSLTPLPPPVQPPPSASPNTIGLNKSFDDSQFSQPMASTLGVKRKRTELVEDDDEVCRRKRKREEEEKHSEELPSGMPTGWAPTGAQPHTHLKIEMGREEEDPHPVTRRKRTKCGAGGPKKGRTGQGQIPEERVKCPLPGCDRDFGREVDAFRHVASVEAHEGFRQSAEWQRILADRGTNPIRYWCTTCYPAGGPGMRKDAFRRHLNTKKHQKNVAAWERLVAAFTNRGESSSSQP
ncbi:hypothetical protein EW146_g8578 [Bondarzewia mesenterica]|uniref:Uncharacterized protein n=1 Tax=Bondarzewia mesenterica TaxID=1095465 RepID=A0A4S4LDR2_9AGAM|nr:hypothetical protein EW146_g8578 [Bondarzewia mesenterica]